MVKIYDFVDDFRYKDPDVDWVNYTFRHGLERRKIYREEQFPYEVQDVKF